MSLIECMDTLKLCGFAGVGYLVRTDGDWHTQGHLQTFKCWKHISYIEKLVRVDIDLEFLVSRPRGSPGGGLVAILALDFQVRAINRGRGVFELLGLVGGHGGGTMSLVCVSPFCRSHEKPKLNLLLFLSWVYWFYFSKCTYYNMFNNI